MPNPPEKVPTALLERSGWRNLSVYWLLLSLVVWWILAEPRPGAWIAAFVAMAVGAGIHQALGGGRLSQLRFRGLLTFIPYFAAHSFRGGLDVSRRAIDPALPLDPGFFHHSLSLPPGPPRVFYQNVVSLLPGTLSARLEGDDLTVHLLADRASAERRLQDLEERVARIFEAGPTSSVAGRSRRPPGE